jgi:acetaldehyde dehydrogenase / alcohol dehydrogenase
MMPRWLPRPALVKAHILPGSRPQVIVTDEPDPAVDALVARSAAALDSIAGWPEDQIDGLITALAAQIAAHADELAAATVAETGIGCVPDKAVKNRFASLGVAQSLTGKPGVGVIGGSSPEALTEIAEPMGVILGLIPMTNPVATLVFKALICIKARDALIASCHGDAAGVGARTAGLLRQVLARYGACADLIQAVPRRPTRQGTAALMRHPGLAMILATGGTAMVTAAYSSGTPAIGVGPGNAPAWICADADVGKAARMVVASKAFDHGIICGSENNLVVDQSVRGPFTAALREAGAAVLGPADCDRLAQVAFDDQDGRLRSAVLGQAATAIAAQAGIAVPASTRLLVAPLPRQAVPDPYGREKLAPILSPFTADGPDDAIGLCRQILGNGGRGHTTIIHTRSQQLQLSFARQIPVSRILVNGPGAHGCIGLGTALPRPPARSAAAPTAAPRPPTTSPTPT